MPNVKDRPTAVLADRHVIQRELRAGGTATVRLAEDRMYRRKGAGKVLRLELAAAPGHERIRREIEIAADRTRVHVLLRNDCCESSGFPKCVMPYMESESPCDWMDRIKQLPLDQALGLARELADLLPSTHVRHDPPTPRAGEHPADRSTINPPGGIPC